jgi:cytidylate kinase
VPVTSEEAEDGWWVSLTDPPPYIDPLDLFVPGDFSSAAFLVALALLGGARDPLEIRDVGLNPTRTGALEVLARMGGVVRVEFAPSGRGQEPIGTVIAERSDLSGCEIGGSEIAGLIDELPILAVVAARAHGRTRITGAGELRVKESDRIRALAENLRAIGVKAEELDDGLEIEGTQRPLSGRVEARHDHRIAMAFGILDALPGNRVEVDDPGVADVSFPGFWEFLGRIGRGASAHRPPREGGSGASRAPVVTIDGPAGSGKSSTAREVAERLGFRHLDSGALYRAITYALLEDGVPVDEWPSLTVTDLDRYPIRLDPKPGGFELSLAGRPLGPELRAATVTERVSLAARVPAVRAWLLDQQRRAGGPGGLVADGRDMGSVVFPDAEVKVFLTADLRERARRRILQDTGREPDARAVEAEASRIAARDRTDAEREASPLRRPVGAVVLDTTSLTMDEQVAHVVGLVESLERPDR